MLLRPSRRSMQRFCSLSWCDAIDFFCRFAGSWPRAFCRSCVAMTAWSPIRVHSDGCWWPVLLANGWFQPSKALFVRSVPSTVARCWFHISAVKVGGVRFSCSRRRDGSVLRTQWLAAEHRWRMRRWNSSLEECVLSCLPVCGSCADQ